MSQARAHRARQPMLMRGPNKGSVVAGAGPPRAHARNQQWVSCRRRGPTAHVSLCSCADPTKGQLSQARAHRARQPMLMRGPNKGSVVAGAGPPRTHARNQQWVSCRRRGPTAHVSLCSCADPTKGQLSQARAHHARQRMVKCSLNICRVLADIKVEATYYFPVLSQRSGGDGVFPGSGSQECIPRSLLQKRHEQ